MRNRKQLLTTAVVAIVAVALARRLAPMVGAIPVVGPIAAEVLG